jgi:hypothetical protein
VPIIAPNPVLEKLRRVVPCDVVPYGDGREWTRLRSAAFSNKQLFDKLQAAWAAAVGMEGFKYALIHCLQGPDAGVWFHVLPNADYEPGCHEISTF